MLETSNVQLINSKNNKKKHTQQANIISVFNDLNKNDHICINNFIDINIINNHIKLNCITDLFLAKIPKKTKYYVSTIRYNTTMNNLFSKINDFGLAFQGLFNIKLITTLPLLYKNNFPSTLNESAFIVIDNHINLKIMNYNDILCYQPMGVNVQFIEGIKLYENGISHLDSAHSNYTNDESKNKLINAYLLLANDYEDNMYIIYHPNIDLININNLLEKINCNNAILFCNSKKINMMWKYTNQSINSNFIGNQNEIISDIIVLST